MPSRSISWIDTARLGKDFCKDRFEKKVDREIVIRPGDPMLLRKCVPTHVVSEMAEGHRSIFWAERHPQSLSGSSTLDSLPSWTAKKSVVLMTGLEAEPQVLFIV